MGKKLKFAVQSLLPTKMFFYSPEICVMNDFPCVPPGVFCAYAGIYMWGKKILKYFYLDYFRKFNFNVFITMGNLHYYNISYIIYTSIYIYIKHIYILVYISICTLVYVEHLSF